MYQQQDPKCLYIYLEYALIAFCIARIQVLQ